METVTEIHVLSVQQSGKATKTNTLDLAVHNKAVESSPKCNYIHIYMYILYSGIYIIYISKIYIYFEYLIHHSICILKNLKQ